MSKPPQLTRVQVALARDFLRRGYTPKRVIAKLRLPLSSPRQLPGALAAPTKHTFTPDDFARIDALRAKHISWRQIAALFGVWPGTLRGHVDVAKGEHEKITNRRESARQKRVALKLQHASANQANGG